MHLKLLFSLQFYSWFILMICVTFPYQVSKLVAFKLFVDDAKVHTTVLNIVLAELSRSFLVTSSSLGGQLDIVITSTRNRTVRSITIENLGISDHSIVIASLSASSPRSAVLSQWRDAPGPTKSFELGKNIRPSKLHGYTIENVVDIFILY